MMRIKTEILSGAKTGIKICGLSRPEDIDYVNEAECRQAGEM